MTTVDGWYRVLVGSPSGEVESEAVSGGADGVADAVVAVRRTREAAWRPEQLALALHRPRQVSLLVLRRLQE